jgi:hypothetical protein
MEYNAAGRALDVNRPAAVAMTSHVGDERISLLFAFAQSPEVPQGLFQEVQLAGELGQFLLRRFRLGAGVGGLRAPRGKLPLLAHQLPGLGFQPLAQLTEACLLCLDLRACRRRLVLDRLELANHGLLLARE